MSEYAPKKFRWESDCKIHGLEIGYGNTEKECHDAAFTKGCDVDYFSLFEN